MLRELTMSEMDLVSGGQDPNDSDPAQDRERALGVPGDMDGNGRSDGFYEGGLAPNSPTAANYIRIHGGINYDDDYFGETPIDTDSPEAEAVERELEQISRNRGTDPIVTVEYDQNTDAFTNIWLGTV